MRIGIFSKLGSSGGSEHRALSLSNAIVRYTGHECVLLCEGKLNNVIRGLLDQRVVVITNVFDGKSPNPDALYSVDSLLIINSDSYTFTQSGYWDGTLIDEGSQVRSFGIDISRIPQMIFLFNFVVSPAKHLSELSACRDIRIITTNKEFDYQIEYRDKHKKIRKFPRIILESPIDPQLISSDKIKSDKIRIGKHSKSFSYKHNQQFKELIDKVNSKIGNLIEWDFMGVSSEYINQIKGISNVRIRPEYSMPVGEYLKGIDLFCFFIAWNRSEPWARAVAEAMMAGCPVLATNKAGNRDQVVNRLNGFLCDSVDDFADGICKLVSDKQMVQAMRNNNLMLSKNFTPDVIVKKLVDFIS